MSKVIVSDLLPLVKIDGREIPLTPREYELLKFLFDHKNLICPTRLIYEKVYKYNADIESRALNCYISYLRKKFRGTGLEGKIETFKGLGYRLNYKESNEIKGECNCTCPSCLKCIGKQVVVKE